MEEFNWAERFRKTTAPFAIDRSNISKPPKGEASRIVRPLGIGSIEYVVSGRGTVTENDVTFQVSAGDVFILHAGAYHDYYGDPDDPWVRIWVQTSGPAVEEILRAYELLKVNHIPQFDLEEDLLEIHRKIHNDTDISVIDREGPRLFLDLVQKIHNEVKRRSAEEEPEPTLAEEVRRYVDSSPDGNISLKELSEKFHFSKQYLIRVFKTKYGLTPYEYVINRRVAIAQSLLKKTNLSVAEIAERLKFCDATYFADFFRKHTDLTPLEFRKKYR